MIIISILIICIIVYKLSFINKNTIYYNDISTDCKLRRWGCCDDKITPKLDSEGTNCT